jgi:hypothetical protein
MTISSTVSERSWPGNGSAKQFDFDGIDCNDDGDFRLWITDDTTLVQTEITTNYSISLNVDQQNDPGGTLTYPVSGEAVPEGETLTLERSSPFVQETNLQEGNAFEPEVIEDMLDQAARERQELLAKLNRAAIIPRGSAYTVDEIVSLIASAVSSSQNFFDTYQDALNEIADLVLAGEVSIQELLLQATIAANHLEEILLPAGYDTVGEYIQNVVNMLTLQAGAQYYNPDTVYNPTGRTAPSFVYGSDGATYVCVGENVQGDDPVGSVTGNWVKVLQEVIDAAAQALAAAQAAQAAADAAQAAADAAQDTADAAQDTADAAATEAASRPFLGSTGYAGHFAQGFNAAASNRDRIRVSHGITMDSTNMHTMNGPLLDKDFRVTWAEGNQQGGRVGTGTMENARIDVWIIGKDDGTCDYACSAGTTEAWNLPSGYTRKQYLFSFRTFAGGQAAYFTKKGKYVYFHEAHNSVINWNVPTSWTTPDHDSFVHPTYTELIKFGVSALGTSGTSYLQYSANGNDGTINYTIAENNNLHEAISGLVWGGYGSGGPWYPFHNTGKVKREGDAGIRLLVMGYKIL